MLISVVMAVYNGELYLKEAVESVLNQTYPDFELVIVNDGSTDNTKEILKSIKDKRVNVIHLDENQGAAKSLNMAIEESTGNWIAIHDADDTSKPERLEEQVNYLKANPGSIGVSSLIKTIPDKLSDSSFDFNDEEEYYNKILSNKAIYEQRLYSCYLCHGTVVYSKEVFYKAGRYNPKYNISYDYNLWLRMFDIAPIQKVPKVLYNYRIRYDSLGKKDTRQTIAELMNISLSYLHKHLKKRLNKKPRIAVIGSKKGSKFIENHIKVNKHYGTNMFFTVRRGTQLKHIHHLFKNRNIDAVALLNHLNSYKIIKFLEKQGMKRNVNLFIIWNHRY